MEDNVNAKDVADIKLESLSISKKPKAPKAKPLGRKAGQEHLRAINIEQFMLDHDCLALMLEHPWVKELKLVSNPYMYATYGRANYKTHTVELSEKITKEPVYIQREVFIRAICHFVAKRLFDEAGEGTAYNLIVSRYMKRSKGQSNSTGTVKALNKSQYN